MEWEECPGLSLSHECTVSSLRGAFVFYREPTASKISIFFLQPFISWYQNVWNIIIPKGNKLMWYIWSVSRVLQAAAGLPWIKPILFSKCLCHAFGFEHDWFVCLTCDCCINFPRGAPRGRERCSDCGFKGLINAEFWIDTRATHNYQLNKGRVFENSLSYQS